MIDPPPPKTWIHKGLEKHANVWSCYFFPTHLWWLGRLWWFWWQTYSAAAKVGHKERVSMKQKVMESIPYNPLNAPVFNLSKATPRWFMNYPNFQTITSNRTMKCSMLREWYWLLTEFHPVDLESSKRFRPRDQPVRYILIQHYILPFEQRLRLAHSPWVCLHRKELNCQGALQEGILREASSSTICVLF